MLTFEIQDIPATHVLAERATCAQSEIGRVLSQAFEHLSRRAGQFKSGPPLARYLDWRETDCDLEAAVPISGEPDLFGDLTIATVPAHKAVTVLHTGSYEGIMEVHRAIQKWIEENGHQMKGAPWESYLDDPTEVAEDNVRTLVGWPIG